MQDIKEAWTVVRTDNGLGIGYVRLTDLKLPNEAAAKARIAEIEGVWTKPHGQYFETQCYRPGTLKETLAGKHLELWLV